MSLLPAIISLHDVMPHTLDETEELLADWLTDIPPERVTLLVVPGLNWQPAQLDRLREWERQGYELAGHGWIHHVRRVKTLYHCLHSILISRRAAEHLSLSENELVTLLNDNYHWFQHHDFKTPELYVPPAWAMGQLDTAALQRLPFRYYESTPGLLDSQQNRFRRLPLAGFEADRRWRGPCLRTWNGINRVVAAPQRPIRLSIHPFDHRYHLAHSLRRWLSRVQPIDYRSLFDSAAPASRPGNATAL
ncbi:polysaccharide deacetylase family protein [Saccharospirillum salsuginis]|uniref:DUF2334 domain-containing protein n=1 Tax=Saccharospirillum salsuginis TaxID=418750 RepID=A0A918N565_9GAMM|nr:polysaccharide deacetylase family protein [Saccharospirillum salsuginis]GGX38211.1 hypothetical protein GCM10007392_00420 [Saccharospirillum salsuginis]